MNLKEHFKKNMVPIGLSLVCFLYYITFLVKHGEMFFGGSDIVTNTAYAMTMFRDVYTAGWTVPKPAHMVLFGSVYWITGDLWFVNLVPIIATALTTFVGCWLILRYYHSKLGCIAFCIFMMTIPRMFFVTMAGGPGCVNTLFLLLAVVCVVRNDRPRYQICSIVFLSLANLTRPDSWPSTYLIILIILVMRPSPKTGSKMKKSDLLFLIPIGMPLIWPLTYWAVWGDPLYVMKTSEAFWIEVASLNDVGIGTKVNGWTGYSIAVRNAFSDLFSLSSWFSLRTAVIVILCLYGIVMMFLKQPRILLLLGCPFLGSILFYLVVTHREFLFRPSYLYYAFVLFTLTLSVGLASVCGLTRHVRHQYVGWFIRAGLACLALWFLTAGPYEEKVIHRTIPKLKDWAAISKRAAPAIERIVGDVKDTSGTPVIITTNPVPASRIALQLLTGENIFLADRLARREKLGHEVHLPDLGGRTVYFAAPEPTRAAVGDFLRRLVLRAREKEMIYNKEGLVVLKCVY
ncbi:MAG: hypothetical protein JRJ47_02660 [Deltaproteobacteria bacterium]|nr:hypothetical protein [Deltaproteobacteria bacterium]